MHFDMLYAVRSKKLISFYALERERKELNFYTVHILFVVFLLKMASTVQCNVIVNCIPRERKKENKIKYCVC